MKKFLITFIACVCFVSGASALEIKQFPKSGDMYKMLNPADPYKTVISGLFRQTVKVGDVDRTFLVYIAKDNAQYQPYVVIVPDGKQDPVAVLEKSGWKEIADAGGMILIVAETVDKKWKADRDLAYLDKLYSVSHVRNWYNVQKGNNYLVAYGDGSSVAQSWAMKTPANFCSFATFGDFSVGADFMKKAGDAPSELKYIPMKEVPMPVWMFVPKMTADVKAVLDYWKYSNKATGDMLSDANATGIFLAKTNGIDTLIDEQDYLAQTRYTVVKDASALNPKRTAIVWKFLSSVIRPVALANGDLRAARSTEEWGAVKKTIVVDGITRYWIEFVPKTLRKTADGVAPLVVYCHGNNNTAEAIVDRTEIFKCAAERGVIVAVPTGALYNDLKQMPNPRWNLEEKADEWNDYSFIREMVKDVTSRLPVDKSRIYLSGQSYGSMATMAFSLRMNDIFAAGASTAAFVIGDDRLLYKSPKILQGNKTPIFLILGEKDMPPFLNPADTELNMSYWIDRNKVGAYDSPVGKYKDGRYNITVWANQDGVPLVQFAKVDEKPHTPLPMDNFIMYDTYLSKFSRGEDGTLYYLGKAVK
ncbi:MAG: PHB depolymerase family esterase [Treponemataceae bacterium]